MSKRLYERYGVQLARYAGPRGKAMFQISVWSATVIGTNYVQLDALQLEALLAGMRQALNAEDLSYEEMVSP